MARAKRTDCGTDHREYTEDFCPECGEEVDAHGNIVDQIEYCTYPDCGCAHNLRGCPMGGKERND